MGLSISSQSASSPMFDEQEFLDVAQHLRASDGREGFQRSAISRAYYAAFLHARRLCREQGVVAQTGSGSDHGVVASILNEMDINIGKEFRLLQQLRRAADYSEREIESVRLAENAQLAIDLATFIRTELDRLT